MSERIELGRIIDSYTKIGDGGKRFLDGDPEELEREVASLLPLLGDGATLESAKALLDECYDAICRGTMSEDGLDTDETDLLEAIEKIIGETETVKAWNGPTRPVT